MQLFGGGFLTQGPVRVLQPRGWIKSALPSLQSSPRFKFENGKHNKMSVVSTKNSKIFSGLSAIAKIWGHSTVRHGSRYYGKVDPLPTKYGGKTNITVLPGIGIGPEIMDSTLEVLNAAKAPLSYEVMTIRPDHEDEDFAQVLISIKRNKVAIKANIETQSKDPLAISRNVALRKLLDLYVYILPLKSFPGIATRFGDLDLVIIRQNTEGEYLMLEHEPREGSVESLKVLTRFNTERLAEYAYKYAVAHNRKHITVMHTSHVYQLTEGYFLDSVLRVGEKYPQIKTRAREAGLAVPEILHAPHRFDMIIATNLNGSMISNFVNGMLGGPALSAGANISEDGIAIFEPGVRNKGSGIVNKGIANPTAMLMAACQLLSHLGHDRTSSIIRTAMYRSIVYDRIRTQELGGAATTRQITDNIIRHVKVLMGPSEWGGVTGPRKHKRWTYLGSR